MKSEASAPVLEAVGAWLLRQPLIPLALVGTVAASLVLSLSEANWVVANTRYVNALWLGLLCGAALARSRFSSLTALAYTVCLSLLGSGEWVGGILRPLWLPHSDILWAMSVRLDTLLLRMNDWGAALAGYGTIHDTGFFIFISVFVLWNVGAWLVWTLVRRRRVWEGLLPVAGLLAANIHLSGQKPMWLSVFIAAAAVLAVFVGYADLQSDWDKRQVDYPSEMGVTWGVSAAILACVITFAAQAALLCGTPTGWRALGDFWRGAQKQTAELTARLFSDVNPPRIKTPSVLPESGDLAGAPAPVDVASAAFPPDLQLIGNAPDQSSSIVMWVQTSDPAPLSADVAERLYSAPPPQHYWRTDLFATYTGTGWNPLDFPEETVTFGPEINPAGRYRLFQRFEILAVHDDNLFAANLPLTATAGTQVRYSPLGDSAILKGTVSNYEVLSWAGNATISELRAAGADYPPEITAAYLQLPAALPRRVRALADRITEMAATPYDKAWLVQEYLRNNFAYTLNVPAPPAGRDAVDYFLFEAPGGFCTYYASAMAVMLRAEGVPARVVSGYLMGTYDFKRAAYGVSSASAHAWVEVYFPVYGWVEFEPTASRNVFIRSDGASPAPNVALLDFPSASTKQVIPWGFVLAGLALLLLGLGVVQVYRTLEPGWNTPRGRARFLYRQMRSTLVRAGVGAPENLTPNEFIAANEGLLANYPALTLALAEATRLYLCATFSVHPPASAEIGRSGRLWVKAGGDWLRLWWRAGWSRLRQARPARKPGSPNRGHRIGAG